MKRRITCAVIVLAALLLLVTNGQATTITFDDSPGDNLDVPTNHGSNITGDLLGFVTTDGTGATPDIVLTWAPIPDFWEYHSGAKIAANFVGQTPVAQMDMQGGEDITITFTTEPDVAVVLHSLQMGDATGHAAADPASTWDLQIWRVSDTTLMKTVSAGPYDASVYVETVNLDFTGAPGEDYVLKFIDTDGDPQIYTCMDNLSFSQVPEPSTLVLLVLAGLAVVAVRRR